jgi:hypothetical protein
MAGRACIDEGESAVGNPDPVQDVRGLAAPTMWSTVPGATLGKKVLVDVSIRIDEGNPFIVRPSMPHGSKASKKLGGIGLRRVE